MFSALFANDTTELAKGPVLKDFNLLMLMKNYAKWQTGSEQIK
jgi:hypothetical protein